MAAWATAVALMSLPLVAMQFTDEIAWDLADFALAGALVVGVGVICEWAARITGHRTYRAAVGVALATAVLLIWGNAALGLIESENNPANLMYGGVLAVGIAGAFVARLQSDGMARALMATALAQALVAVIALLAGLGTMDLDIVMLTGFFAALWLTSAWLFRRAARERASAGAAA